MNSRERVKCAVELGQPDRVPLDFSATNATRARLQAHFGVSRHRELLQALHVDIVDLRGVVDPEYNGPRPLVQSLPGGITENMWGMRTRVVESATGLEECYCEFPLAQATSIEELTRYQWPNPGWFSFAGFANRLAKWEGMAVMASGASIFQHPSFLRGLDNLLVDMVAAPEMADFLLDRFTDYYVAYFDRMFTAAAGAIDILRIADDMGMQDRLLLAPELFARFIVPRVARLADMAHSHGVAVMFHSCGSIVPFVEPLIAAGVDVLDPLQVTAAGMDPQLLKARFGHRICLHGGVDTQYLLPQGTPEQVAQAVHELIHTLGPAGGYILAPCHVLQADVPVDNILALYEAAHTGGSAIYR